MAADEKWYFTKTQLANTPSRKCGLDADKELSYRQQAANFIQDMGQRLKVTQLCINTAIVYMHRFYIFHSFTQFHRNHMAAASLFLAAKVEEQPRKLEHVITVSYWCLYREEPKFDTKSEHYLEQAQELVFNENVLLQTLGFDVAIDHPHTHVVRCCHLVRANKELAQTSYFMASNSLHLTTMCLQYKPTVVACFCIHLACKWSNWEIPQSNEGKDWFTYVDSSVSLEQLEQLTAEFLVIFDKCPSRLKKMSGKKDDSFGLISHNMTGPQMDHEPRKIRPTFPSGRPNLPGMPQEGSTSSSSMPQARQGSADESKKLHSGPPRVDYKEYKEKKAREAALAAAGTAVPTSKDGKPPPPPQSHGQQSRPPALPHHLAKREPSKREMLARENAKREALQQDPNSRRDASMQRPVDPLSMQSQLGHEVRDPKRSRDVPDLVAGSSQQQLGETGMLAQKRPENNNQLPLDPNNPSSRRSRDPSDVLQSASSHHHNHHHHHRHHHSDHARRDVGQRPSPSNHHANQAAHNSNPMKRSRDGLDVGVLGQPTIQAKRPREGTDPLLNMLDPTKRPREPTDSSHPFISLKTESNVQSSDSSQQIEQRHSIELKQSSTSVKYPPEPKAHQLPSLSTFSDNRQNKPLLAANTASVSNAQRQFSHSRPGKTYDLEQSRLGKPDKRDPKLQQQVHQDSHSLRSSQLTINKSPSSSMSRSKSPSDFLKMSESRSRSPLVPPSLMDHEKKNVTPEVSKRTTDILSTRPSGHLFSPEDDREDTTLPSLDLPELVTTKFEKPSPSLRSKFRTTPEKPRDSLLAPPSFVLPSSPTSPVTQGKVSLPTTPTTPNSDSHKRRRTQSSSSEPELVPMVRKIDDIPGFQTLMKDGSMGIKLSGRLPESIMDQSLPATPGKDSSSFRQEPLSDSRLATKQTKTEPKPEEFVGLHPVKQEYSVFETKPAEPIMPLLAVKTEPLPTPNAIEVPRATEENVGGGEHHRKKKKEKHGKKDKDKDRNREERKHKHKKKDRDKAKEEKAAAAAAATAAAAVSAPIRITIPKDKLNLDSKRSPPPQESTSALKIKIPKERLKVDSPPMPSSSSTTSSVALGGLKIKIGKELIGERRLNASPSDQSSRKRSNDHPPSRAPPANPPRRNYNKQNGHPDRKVPLKLDSGSFQPSPGCRQ